MFQKPHYSQTTAIVYDVAEGHCIKLNRRSRRTCWDDGSGAMDTLRGHLKRKYLNIVYMDIDEVMRSCLVFTSPANIFCSMLQNFSFLFSGTCNIAQSGNDVQIAETSFSSSTYHICNRIHPLSLLQSVHIQRIVSAQKKLYVCYIVIFSVRLIKSCASSTRDLVILSSIDSERATERIQPLMEADWHTITLNVDVCSY